MNEITRIPRHRQTPISFRSDIAAELLSKLTRDGRSQAQVIEEALTKAIEAKANLTVEERNARIDAIVKPLHGLQGKSYHEIRTEMYDENGLPL
jgi:hypothetical protein